MRRFVSAVALAAILISGGTAQAASGWSHYKDHYVRWHVKMAKPAEDPKQVARFLHLRASAIRRAEHANDRYEEWLQQQAYLAKQAATVPSPEPVHYSTGGVAGIIMSIFGPYGPQAVSVATCESGLNPRAVNPNGFFGLWQFALGTWQGLGYSGNPIDYSATVQTQAAWKLFQSSGWAPWTCA